MHQLFSGETAPLRLAARRKLEEEERKAFGWRTLRKRWLGWLAKLISCGRVKYNSYKLASLEGK